MYFWNLNGLKQQISENRIGEPEVFYYILLFVALGAAGIEFASLFPNDAPNSWDYLDSALSTLIPTVGTVMAYRANGGASGTNFASKYFSIGWVVSIRFLVYFVPVALAMAVYYLVTDWPSAATDESTATSWFEVTLFSAWYTALYARIAKHIRDVRAA